MPQIILAVSPERRSERSLDSPFHGSRSKRNPSGQQATKCRYNKTVLPQTRDYDTTLEMRNDQNYFNAHPYAGSWPSWATVA